MTTTRIPVWPSDPVNLEILSVSEDTLSGFQADPFGEIAARCNVPPETVLERVRAMLEAGTIRRVRQTVQATRLAPGALVAWKLPAAKLEAAFEFMAGSDPFSGHVVLRSTDQGAAGHEFRLWTTLKVPQGFSLLRHCQYLQTRVGAEAFRAMPARRLFVLGVGHLRRRLVQVGSRSDVPTEARSTDVIALDPRQWAVLAALKRELTAHEIRRDVWTSRAAEANLSREDFEAVARELEGLGLIGRFSTFLEHVKELDGGERVTRYNALFHWAVPAGRELEAGREVGRHHILTHAYWREAGPEFGDVNIMGVAHGLDKDLLLEHKRAIDQHLSDIGMPFTYTNVFWGGRSEIKPSEVLPGAYERWCRDSDLDPEIMKEAG